MTRFFSRTRRVLAGLAAGMAALLAPMRASAEPAMWLIEDADSRIYLLGTIHMLPKGHEWRTPKIEAAIAESDELWLEIADLESFLAQMTATIAVFSNGLSPREPLSSRMTEEQFAELDRVAQQVGFSARSLNAFRPWLAGMLIETAGYASKEIEPGVDMQLSREFRKKRIPVKGFETIGQQIAVFSGMSKEDEMDYLLSTIESADASGKVFGEMVGVWAKGDEKTLATGMVADMKKESPEFYDAILTQRNQGMADKIASILDGKGVSFVAVGAAHLVGPDSIQALLAQKGIKSARH
jgi:uncharacterized protein YbaP (TraB family)